MNLNASDAAPGLLDFNFIARPDKLPQRNPQSDTLNPARSIWVIAAYTGVYC